MKVYRGIVEDNIDPEKFFRVRVRITGIHANGISKESLPFAEVMSSTTFGLSNGIGISSVLQVGTWVWVVLEDDNPNKPIVIGVVTGSGDASQSLNGKSDESYTSVQSITTKGGHSIILGDVGGDSNITIKHSSGSQIQIDNDGNIFITGVKDMSLEAPGSISIKSNNVKFDTPTTNFTGNVDIAKVSTANDHLSSGKSGKSHTHTAPHGETTPPH